MKRQRMIVLWAVVMVLCFVFTACTIEKEKADNSITGLKDVTATCGDTVPALNATAAYGEVVYGLAKAVEGTAKESLTYGEYKGTLTVGTYYVKASVAEADDYKAAEAYATITVAHQAFASIEGDGETKHETTADGKYRVWTEKKCACGETIIGNETITEKLPATIVGVMDISDKCGYVVATNGITANKGTLKFELATAVDGTDKEKLTYAALTEEPLNAGTYYLKVSVAEGEDFGAATAYAKITINHKAYDEIDGEGSFVAPVFDTKTKGYYTKDCACGTEIHNGEYVSVRITVDGTALADQVVEVGGKLAVPTDAPVARDGYKLVLLNNGEEFVFSAITVNDFASYALTVKEYALETRTGKITVGSDSRWMLEENNEAGITAENKSSFEQKDGYVEAKTAYYPKNATACMQLDLGYGLLNEYYSYAFTFKSTQGTSVWFGGNYENGRFEYTDEMAAANTVVTVVIVVDSDENMIVSFDGVQRNYGKVYNLNNQTLCFQDKSETFANRGTRYTVTITELVASYDYIEQAKAILATIPTDAETITFDNAFDLQVLIEAFDNVAVHLSDKEKQTVAVNADVRARVEEIVNDHVYYANNIIKDLPDFDNGNAITPDNEDRLYDMVIEYVGYVKTAFTAEELASYIEPENISLYRYYFYVNRVEAVKEIATKISLIDNGTPSTPNGNGTSYITGNGSITLPKINYNLYEYVTLAFVGRVENGHQATFSITYGEQTTTRKTSNLWNETNKQWKSGDWVQLHIRKVGDKYYVGLSSAQLYDQNNAVELPQDVLNGKVGLTINVVNDFIQPDIEGASTSDMVTITFTPNYTKESDHQAAIANTVRGTLLKPDVDVYTVEYTFKNASGAEDSLLQYYIAGKQLALPTAPDGYKDHHTYAFDGWYDGETKYNGGETINGNIQLVAKYVITEYETHTVEFFKNDTDSDAYETKTINYGDKLVLPQTNPPKEPIGTTRYVFVKWVIEGTDIEATTETIVTDDMTIVAVFTELKPLTITLTNLETEDIVDSTTYYTADVFVRPEDPVRTGYKFAGWYTEDGVLYDFATKLEGNLTLVAKWLAPNGTNKKEILVTATQVGESASNFTNDGLTTAAKLGATWFYDSDGVLFENWTRATINASTISQVWTLPLINYNEYKKVEFGLRVVGGPGTAKLGTTDFAFPQKDNFTFVIKEGKLYVYVVNAYTTVLTSVSLPEAVLNGQQAFTITFNLSPKTFYISQFHAISEYIEYMSDAVAASTELSSWITTNGITAENITAEQKDEFKKKLVAMYIARGNMTTREAAANPVASNITALQAAVKVDDVWTDVFAATDCSMNNIERDKQYDKTDWTVHNDAYNGLNPKTTTFLYSYKTSGSVSSVTITLPKMNLEELGMSLFFNIGLNLGATPKIYSNLQNESGEYEMTELGTINTNKDYIYNVGIYKDAQGWHLMYNQAATKKVFDLSDEQVMGKEALTFEIRPTTAGSFWVYMSDISAKF